MDDILEQTNGSKNFKSICTIYLLTSIATPIF